MKKILLAVFCLMGICAAQAKHALPEKYYQEVWCKEHGGEIEHVLPDGTRVDCLTEDYAVEFDFAPKWAESIGQSLYYASKTSRRPAIVLIIETGKDFKHYYKITKLCKDYDINLSYMKKPKNPQPYKAEESLLQSIINFILNFLSQILKIFN